MTSRSATAQSSALASSQKKRSSRVKPEFIVSFSGDMYYDPIFDKYLKFYFAVRQNRRVLRKNRIINKKNEIIDKNLKKVIKSGRTTLHSNFKLMGLPEGKENHKDQESRAIHSKKLLTTFRVQKSNNKLSSLEKDEFANFLEKEQKKLKGKLHDRKSALI